MKRREFLATLSLLFGVTSVRANAPANQIKAVRLWPASEYTRITLESSRDTEFSFFMLSDPERLVLDLYGVGLSSILKNLSQEILPEDPYIAQIRAGQNAPGVVRLVVELKNRIRPNIFTLAPVAPYGYRLVVDLYPAVEEDPLLAFLQSLPRSKNQPPVEAKSPTQPITPGERPPFTVVIDPGHGGEDSGAIGRNGNYEKTVVLAIAQELKKLIDQAPNMRAALTRTGDYFIPLGDRVRKARALKADLFISIHADAFMDRTVEGASVFVLSDHGASSTAARWLANKENLSDLVGGFKVSASDDVLVRTLFDLSQSNTRAESNRFAKTVLRSIGATSPLHKSEVERAAFAVLKAPDVPSVLIETSFITNPLEEKKLISPSFQKELARAIFTSIQKYVHSQAYADNTQ